MGVPFAIVNAAVTSSTYLLYSITVGHATESLTQERKHLFLIALPDTAEIARSVRHVYTDIIEERGV